MKLKRRLPKLPKINWKLFLTVMVIIVLVVAAVKVIPKFISGGDQEVSYVILEKEQVPEEIQEILPRYKMLERALAAKVQDDIYVIVTRGEKLTAGYSVDIEQIMIIKDHDEEKLMVHAAFKDPKADDLVAQVISYPYVVARVELEELPKKIDLKVTYQE
ncbi:hypothetical protein Amet_4136 [Alkaliphilus metalliredigens QYMF]|uniref:PrcB C-terminal domain-containing protein n=1 Tax=Alkaliphilus metalliredigens (strain QYMF) TaxID=293826 RepID=A6TVJ9_ALKMQ|nr:protease complex subunit PrcB family protein [Alkaliphilus metalliredigens]ABR50217.1 hypothetical protein Amet_4136 [Alkaliphilus metalliredigens QYMF]